MRLKEPRIAPLDESKWTEEQKQLMKGQEMRGKVQNIFRTLINHEKLAKRWLVFGAHILSKSSLDPREREIVILRIGWLCQSGYEWGQHVLIGRACGLNDQEILRLQKSSDTEGWTEHERFLIKAADELHDDAFISDETWAGLRKKLNDQQMMDLVFTCGQYTLVSMALNSFGVQLDSDLPGWDLN